MPNPVSEIPAMQALQIGATPVIKQLIDNMQLMERIDERSLIKKEACHLSVGTRIAALIINQLSERKALYKVDEFYEKQDVELLFGPNVAASDFNDDALGRALDALYHAGLDNIYWEAAQGVQQAAASLTWGQLHFDTTSMIYTGLPKEPEANASDGDTPIKIVRGHSKDNQPQWPQIKIGMGTTAEGIPIFGEALDGNQDDKTWNPHMMEAIKKWLSPEQLRDAILIADSAFVTRDNLKSVKQKDESDLHFISRLPETLKNADTLKDKAWAANQWQEIGSFSDVKGAATYWMYPARTEIDGETYRCLVLYSDKLDGRKKKAIDAKLAKEAKHWQKEAEKLAKQTFACEADATKALNQFARDHQGSHILQGHVVSQEQKGKRKRRGRPKKDEVPPPTVTVYRVNIQIDSPTDEEMNRLHEQASTFILITNVMDKKALSDIDILKGYKGQQVVENRFRFLKSPYFVGRVFLEKPKRVEAFATVMMLSVMVYSLFEYLIRKNMEQEQEPLDLLGGSRKSFRPTGESVLEILDDTMILKTEQHGETHRLYASNNRPQVTRIMKLLEMNMAIYTNPPEKNNVEISSQ